MMGQRAKRVHEFDVSGVVGSNHSWPAYYARPEIARSVVEHVYFLPAGNGDKIVDQGEGGANGIR
ncbi:MAG: hypothetical protein CM1200mP2_44730 [Planctomycetaceae bacterium]|nr:MAG: hypothetical protein CM1200mP2_44730 [Planctomycetaceae bacterium]